jgi:hypothetical protein
MKRRLPFLIAVAIIAAGALGGCTQRETNNPFIGPNGAANEQPWGALAPSPDAAHRG